MENWKVLLPEHHEGYVESEEWLATNSVAAGRSGLPRERQALLQGVAICGHCGRVMQVRYASAVQYLCQRSLDGEGAVSGLWDALPGAHAEPSTFLAM